MKNFAGKRRQLSVDDFFNREKHLFAAFSLASVLNFFRHILSHLLRGAFAPAAQDVDTEIPDGRCQQSLSLLGRHQFARPAPQSDEGILKHILSIGFTTKHTAGRPLQALFNMPESRQKHR